MRRGTTPTHYFPVDDEEFDFEALDKLYITYSQFRKTVVEKKLEDCEFEDGKIVTKLTQAETLKFKKGTVQIQIRGKTTGGDAIVSPIMVTDAEEILKDGEI